MTNKKTKFLSLFFALALILTVTMFGVYALKYGKLTTGGSVGLILHDCAVAVKGEIIGDGVLTSIDEETQEAVYTNSPDGKPLNEYRLLFDTVTMKEDEHTKTITLEDKIYFSDLTPNGLPETIIMKFTITNLSTFTIDATINQPNLSGGNYEEDENGVMVAPVGIKTTTSASERDTTNEGPAVTRIKAGEYAYLYAHFQINPTTIDDGIDYLSLLEDCQFNAGMEFRKYNPIQFVEGSKTYIELGKRVVNDVEEPVRWLAYAYYDNGWKKMPNTGLDGLDGKQVRCIMEKVYVNKQFSNAGLFAGDAGYPFHCNGPLHNYMINDSNAVSQFMRDFGITSEQVNFYNINKEHCASGEASFRIPQRADIVFLDDYQALNAYSGTPTAYWNKDTFYWGFIHMWYATCVEADGRLMESYLPDGVTMGVRPIFEMTYKAPA